MALIPTSPAILDVKKDILQYSSEPSSENNPTDSTPTMVNSDQINIIKHENMVTDNNSNRNNTNSKLNSFESSISKEYMALTPVKLNDFSSPIKANMLSQNSVTTNKFKPFMKSLSNSPTKILYKDKFNMISKDLEKLLDNLNIVYQKIGYSNSQIKEKEKLIFTALSKSIDDFNNNAEIEMNELSINNDINQQILNSMLEKLNDPSGLTTIPDLYIRNAILLPQRKTVPDSPKKSLSLIEVKTSLDGAREFIFKSFIHVILIFLKENINLQILLNNVGEVIADLDETDKGIVNTLPNLEVSQKFYDIFNNNCNDIGKLAELVKENKKILLSEPQFDKIDQNRITQMKRIYNIYQQEYNFRFQNIRSIIKEIETTLSELNTSPNSDIDDKINLLIAKYKNSNNNKNELLPVSKSIIEQLSEVLIMHKQIKDERTSLKSDLFSQCSKLWKQLEIPQEHVHSFLDVNKGLGLDNIRNFQDELSSLNIMKKKLIKKLIENSWNKINELWVTVQTEDCEKEAFVSEFERMKADAQTLEDDENILEYCEVEIRKLEAKLAILAPVLRLIKEFESLQEDKIFLENSSKDSSRLLSKNSHKILLQEEKARKRITRHFPKVLYELKVKLEEAHGMFKKPFMLKGQNLQDLILREEEEFKNKFPRSVLSMGRVKKNNVPSKINTKNNSRSRIIPDKSAEKYRIAKMKTPKRNSRMTVENSLKRNSSESRINIHKTPIDRTNVTPAIMRSKSAEIKRTTPRYMQGTTNSVSPPKPQTKLLPPTVIEKRAFAPMHSTNSALKHRPILQRSKSEILPNGSSSPHSNKDVLRSIRSGRLRPISMNKLNTIHKTNIPILFKSKSTIPKSMATTKCPVRTSPILPMINTKVNDSAQSNTSSLRDTNVQDTQVSLREDTISPTSADKEKLSSPYKESNGSIYKLSMSPDGKFQLNIQQNNDMDMDTQFDDTSIFEDDEMGPGFVKWKQEQLAKLETLKQTHKPQVTPDLLAQENVAPIPH